MSCLNYLSLYPLCLEGQLWILLKVLRCCHGYGSKWGENDQKNSIMDGSCTAAIHQLTQLWQCSNHIHATQPPYSSDLTPCDFRLSPRLKIGLRGPHFATVDKFSVTASLCTISKEVFHKCCKARQNLVSVRVSMHVHACTHVKGMYLEGNQTGILKFYTWFLGTFWYYHMYAEYS